MSDLFLCIPMSADNSSDTFFQATAAINTATSAMTTNIMDSILAAKSAADLDRLESSLNEFMNFRIYLRACCARISKFCDEQRLLLDERTSEIEREQPSDNGYLCTLSGSILGYKAENKNLAVTKSAVSVNKTTPAIVPTGRALPTCVDFCITQYAQTRVQLPLAISTADIRPALHVYQQSLYLCVYPGFYCRVPFPVTIDTNAAEDRKRTVRCRAITRQACNERRKHAMYPCKYAHCGEPLIKVSSAGRCLSCPQFGNSSTWSADSEQITERDARTILMYGLSDVVAVACWAANKKITGCWTELDIA